MCETRYGDWIETVSGKKFYPLDPHPEDVDIEDIAHALSLICRFVGHCREFYSVAQHSVLVSRNLPTELGRWGLLHDAAEAYIGDISRPLKKFIRSGKETIKDVEIRILGCIGDALGMEMPDGAGWVKIKTIDDRALATEARDMMVYPKDWDSLRGVKPFGEKITPISWERSKEEFLKSWRKNDERV